MKKQSSTTGFLYVMLCTALLSNVPSTRSEDFVSTSFSSSSSRQLSLSSPTASPTQWPLFACRCDDNNLCLSDALTYEKQGIDPVLRLCIFVNDSLSIVTLNSLRAVQTDFVQTFLHNSTSMLPAKQGNVSGVLRTCQDQLCVAEVKISSSFYDAGRPQDLTVEGLALVQEPLLPSPPPPASRRSLRSNSTTGGSPTTVNTTRLEMRFSTTMALASMSSYGVDGGVAQIQETGPSPGSGGTPSGATGSALPRGSTVSAQGLIFPISACVVLVGLATAAGVQKRREHLKQVGEEAECDLD